MTSDGHNLVMTKVGIADLKAHLSEHIRKVRGGRTLTIVDRNTPVARIVPFEPNAPLEIRKASRKPSAIRLPRAPGAPTDSLSELLADRSRR